MSNTIYQLCTYNNTKCSVRLKEKKLHPSIGLESCSLYIKIGQCTWLVYTYMASFAVGIYIYIGNKIKKNLKQLFPSVRRRNREIPKLWQRAPLWNQHKNPLSLRRLVITTSISSQGAPLHRNHRLLDSSMNRWEPDDSHVVNQSVRLCLKISVIIMAAAA